MPHEHCTGRWINMKLKPTTGPEEDDGEMTINTHPGTVFNGTHHKTGASLTNTSCDGVNLRLTRITLAETVCYRGRIEPVSPNRDVIKEGRFERTKNIFDAAGKGNQYFDSGDWTGEKIT